MNTWQPADIAAIIIAVALALVIASVPIGHMFGRSLPDNDASEFYGNTVLAALSLVSAYLGYRIGSKSS